MKIQIRKGCFETNSSSVHSLCICTKQEYENWKKGNLIYDHISEELMIPWPGMNDPGTSPRYQTEKEYDKFFSKTLSSPKEKLYKEFNAPDGTPMVVFGYFGEWH